LACLTIADVPFIFWTVPTAGEAKTGVTSPPIDRRINIIAKGTNNLLKLKRYISNLPEKS